MKKLLPLLTVAILGLTALCSEAQPFSLANTSTLVTLAPGGTASIGFVVKGPNTDYVPTMMIRAVGPSLVNFGINNPVASPQFVLIANGRTGQTGLVGTVGTLIPASRVNWDASFATSGAFPLNGNEANTGAVNFFSMLPGAYSVQVSDSSGKGGMVLVEVYVNATLVPLSGVQPD